jgi:hypothetical protein
MARNFGLTPQRDSQERAALWPLWLVALIALGVINAASLLHHS